MFYVSILLRNMMFPFVVPERVSGAEPAPVMRFVLKSETRFQRLGRPF